MPAMLEHTNYSVADAKATAAWMEKLFGWHIRWEGPSRDGSGYSVHVGTDTQYLALYSEADAARSNENNYSTVGGLNHIAVVVDDIDAAEDGILAHGFKTGQHGDYEPGRRFYFHDADGIEYEVVSYA